MKISAILLKYPTRVFHTFKGKANAKLEFCTYWFGIKNLIKIKIIAGLINYTFEVKNRLLRVFFSTFWGQKKLIFFFENIVESSNIFWWFWWFCLLLNHWDSSFTYLFAAEPLNFLYCWTFEIICYCWTFEIMPWIMYLFTAEPLDFIYCWTFEIICLLLNLWIFFTAEPLDFFYCWTFEIMPRDIHIECSKQFKWNLYFYVSGQSGSFWAVLKLL